MAKYTEDHEQIDELLDKRSEREKYYTLVDYKTEVCSLCKMSHKNYTCLNDNT